MLLRLVIYFNKTQRARSEIALKYPPLIVFRLSVTEQQIALAFSVLLGACGGFLLYNS